MEGKFKDLSDLVVIMWPHLRSKGPSDVTPGPSLVSSVTTPAVSSEAGPTPTGYSYKNVHWPKSGVSTGYNNFHY